MNTLNKIMRFIVSGCVLVCSSMGYAQTTNSDGEKSVSLEAPFSVRNAFYNKYGRPWAAVSQDQQREFISQINKNADSPTPAGSFAPPAKQSNAKSNSATPFSVRNAFYNKTGINWDMANPKDQKKFLKNLQQAEKKKRLAVKAYKKNIKEKQKKKNKAKKNERAISAARERAQKQEDKAEAVKKKNSLKRVNALKRKLSQR